MTKATTTKATTKFTPQEVAYRLPGAQWKRRVVKTERALDRLLDKLADEGAEVLTRDAEGY